MQNILLGCVADDFTGASDAASFLKAGGLNTILLSGIPDRSFVLPENCSAVVIALKTRTQETTAAVADSLSAISWLEAQGTKQFYIKYCSTFDSTPHGNIGPIVDAVMEHLHVSYTLLCPSAPQNGRTVRNGILYVNGTPLAESSMRQHPLTPMWASRISELMKPQGKYASFELSRDLLSSNRETVLNELKRSGGDSLQGYLIPDYETDADAERIAAVFGDDRLLTGGSGLLSALARHTGALNQESISFDGVCSPAVILSGSCSVATRSQIQQYLQTGAAGLHISSENKFNAQQLWADMEKSCCKAPIFYAYDTPENLEQLSDEKRAEFSSLFENTLADLASCAEKHGIRRFIVAGGETSGAVTKRLSFSAFWIGESVAPGVPVLIPVDQNDVRIVLKSGNFGQNDFFLRALQMTGDHPQKNN